MQRFKRYAVYFRKGSKFQSIVKWANEYVPYFTYDVFDYFCPFLFSFSRLNNSSRQKNRRLPNFSKERERERENMTSKTSIHTHNDFKFYLVVIQLETNLVPFHAGLTFISFHFSCVNCVWLALWNSIALQLEIND